MSEPETKALAVSQVSLNHDFQPREKGEDAEHVEQMALVYAEWKAAGCPEPCPLPKPEVWKLGGVFQLTKGFNRLRAAMKAGVERLVFVVHRGSVGEAKCHAADSNLGQHALPMGRADRKRAMLMFYDNFVGSPSTKMLARKYGVSEQTARRWLEDHDPERKGDAERVGADGKRQAVVNTHKPKADLFAGCGDPPEGGRESRPPSGGLPGREMPPPPKAAGGKGDDPYPPDERFMPHAAEAGRIAVELASVKQRMEAVAATLKRILPDPRHVVANRLHLHATFLPNLLAMIEDVAGNTPTHTCPQCAGEAHTGGEACKLCSGYGLVSAGDADRSKALWKKAGSRYEKLVKEADLVEAGA